MEIYMLGLLLIRLLLCQAAALVSAPISKP